MCHHHHKIFIQECSFKDHNELQVTLTPNVSISERVVWAAAWFSLALQQLAVCMLKCYEASHKALQILYSFSLFFLQMFHSWFSQSSCVAQHLRETPYSQWLMVTYFLGAPLDHGKHIFLARRSELNQRFHSPFNLSTITSLFLLHQNRRKHGECSIYMHNTRPADAVFGFLMLSSL